MNIVMLGPFGFKAKSTMRERALPMAKALTRRGHQVTIIVPPWDNPEDSGEVWVDEGVDIINAPLPSNTGYLFHAKLTTWMVRQTLLRKPDVVHFFKPKAYAGLAHTALYWLRKLKRHGIKLVVDADDWEQAWNDVNDYTASETRLFNWQEPWGLAHADVVTVASLALQAMVRKEGVPREKIVYIPNGIRVIENPLNVLRAYTYWHPYLNRVAVAAEPNPGIGGPPPAAFFDYRLTQEDLGYRIRTKYNLFGHPVILLYTRFAEFSLNTLLKVIDATYNLMPEARWLIVGQGFFGEEKTLAEKARLSGLSHLLHFAGWVPMEALPYYFAAANTALHLYDDNVINRTKCSVKLLDLLYAGVPVVASAVGQNKAYIWHGKTGFLVQPGKPALIAPALVAILSSYPIQRSMGDAASHFVQRHFHWNELAKRAENAYAK